MVFRFAVFRLEKDEAVGTRQDYALNEEMRNDPFFLQSHD
jgi:hypothetical protein